MRMQGKVIEWQDGKGFGMIEPIDGTPALFFHENFLLHPTRRPQVGDSVHFVIATNSEGKRRAEKISLLNKRRSKQTDYLFDIVYIALAGLFFLCILIFVSQQKLNPIVAFVYLFISLLTYFLYWRDKNKAKNEQRRLPENTLHLCSLAGGWPGALIAQRTLHHKSRKRSFQMIFVTTILFNLIFVALYATYLSEFDPNNIISKTYTILRNQVHSSSDSQIQHKNKGPVYSWTNTNGKRVYSTVGFPVNEPYTEGKIEWQ